MSSVSTEAKNVNMEASFVRLFKRKNMKLQKKHIQACVGLCRGQNNVTSTVAHISVLYAFFLASVSYKSYFYVTFTHSISYFSSLFVFYVFFLARISFYLYPCLLLLFASQPEWGYTWTGGEKGGSDQLWNRFRWTDYKFLNRVYNKFRETEHEFLK